MSKVSLIIDSWFLIAATGMEKNEYPGMSKRILLKIEELMETHKLKFIYILWPVYYETLNTKVVNNPVALDRLKKLLRKFKPFLLNADDSSFRTSSLDSIMNSKRSVLSLVDRVISEFVFNLAEEHPYEKFVLITNDYPFYGLVKRRKNVEVWLGRDYA